MHIYTQACKHNVTKRDIISS